MRKFCQNLQNAQLCRPKTGILSAFLPSAAGQNSDTFPVLHTVERGVSLQGRENFRGYPFRHRCAMPPSPRGRLNSLSQSLTALTAPSERESLAYPQMPSRENEIAERPQTLRYLEIKNNFSADHAQSARGGHSKSSSTAPPWPSAPPFAGR